MTPEEAELARIRQEVSSLETELVVAEEELANERATVAAFRARYLRAIAPRKARIDELEALLAARVSSAAPTDLTAAETATEASRRWARSARIADLGDPGDVPLSAPSEELRALYRRVARLTHPDLASDDNDRRRRTGLMTQVNKAYEAGDINALTRIEVEASVAVPQGTGVGGELVAAIRQREAARSRLAAVESELTALTSDALSVLARRVAEAEAADRDLLGEMADELDRRAATLEGELASTGKVR